MDCLVCGHPAELYFEKEFGFRCLQTVQCQRCGRCAFVHSSTHRSLTQAQWEDLNHHVHATYQGQEANLADPDWIRRLHSQAEILWDLRSLGLLPQAGRWLDYGCGDGKLSDLLQGRQALLKFDRYMHRPGYLETAELAGGSFDFVLTTSVFEHLTERAQFDEINALVRPGGAMGIHTMVREVVPRDPGWFYLLPVHCAFHTNASMETLMRQWGYSESIYNLDARLWLLFKPNDLNISSRIQEANMRPGGPQYFHKAGFMDYWK